MDIYPFNPERRLGYVYQVDGTFADIRLTTAHKLPRSQYGVQVGRGEVGEFVVIEVAGIAIFGRILRIGMPPVRAEQLSIEGRDEVAVEARVQLLSSLSLDGVSVRGISAYPKIGDIAYAANSESVLSVIGTRERASEGVIQIGHLSTDQSVSVDVPFQKLFGRHLAIVGATGSGKSWTVASLTEAVAKANGKLILIDATGEYSTLGDNAFHVALGSLDGEPDGTRLTSVPHYSMRESDRNAFFRPSSGSQLPKLREAIRSLRLANAISLDDQALEAHRSIVATDGTIVKNGQLIRLLDDARNAYIDKVEDTSYPFDLRLLAKQIQQECVWPTGRGTNINCYGDTDWNTLGYCLSLVSRVDDITQTDSVMNVIYTSEAGRGLLPGIRRWYDQDKHPVLRISLRGLPFLNNLREIVVNIIGQALLGWARQGAFSSKPLVVALDEAHQFFDINIGDELASAQLNAFDQIAKEGRKFGLTVCMATQRPGDLPAGVLSQVGMTIVHRLADGRDRQRIEQAAAEQDQSAMRLLPGLVPGEAVLMGVDFPVPMSVQLRRPTSPPASDGPDYSQWRV